MRIVPIWHFFIHTWSPVFSGIGQLSNEVSLQVRHLADSTSGLREHYRPTRYMHWSLSWIDSLSRSSLCLYFKLLVLSVHSSGKYDISFLTKHLMVPGCSRHSVTWQSRHGPRAVHGSSATWRKLHEIIGIITWNWNKTSQSFRLPAILFWVLDSRCLFRALAVPIQVCFYVSSSMPCPWKCVNNNKAYCSGQWSLSLGLTQQQNNRQKNQQRTKI